MAKSSSLILAVVLMTFLTSCSGSQGPSGGGGVAPAAPEEKKAASKEEALGMLPSANRAFFEKWTHEVVKACDPSQALGLTNDANNSGNGIDGAELILFNKGSLLFSDGESLALLSGYNSMGLSEEGKVRKAVDFNGQGYDISAEWRRVGSHCEISLYGQKIFEATIAKSFVVGAQWNKGKVAQVVAGVPVLKSLGSTGLSEARKTGVYELVAQALRPTKDALTIIGSRLNLSAEQAQSFFTISSYTSDQSSLRVIDSTPSIWTTEGNDNIVASAETLKNTFDGSNRALGFEIRLAIPEYSFGGVTNIADAGNLKMTMAVSILKKDTQFTYGASALDLLGVVPFSKDEASLCTKERARTYLGRELVSSPITPSVEFLVSPCANLYREIDNLNYENGLFKSVIATVFANVNPSPQYQYSGWDRVLSRLALSELAAHKNIVSELDPRAITTIVGRISDHLASIENQLSGTSHLSPQRSSILQLGLDWSFGGNVVSGTKIGQILFALDNTMETFKDSSLRLLADLARMPNSFDDSLAFARNIDATYRSESVKAFGLARELKYVEFEQNVFNQVLQRRVPLSEMQDWIVRFSAIKTEISKFPALDSFRGSLVGSSLKWLANGQASVTDLNGVYSALNNAIVPFEESTRSAIERLSESLVDNKPILDFARSITGEYKTLSIAIRDNAVASDFESWGKTFFSSVLTARPAIEQLRAWNEMWVAAVAFSLREKARTVDEFGSTNNWHVKSVIETALKENWTNTEFTQLEIIAQVAKFKNACESKLGASSLADCAELSRFSKQSKKFFDPSFGGRYVGLSRDFVSILTQLKSNDYTTLRWKFVDGFFGSFDIIWSKCDQAQFSNQISKLKSQMSTYLVTADQLARWDLERKMSATLDSCTN